MFNNLMTQQGSVIIALSLALLAGGALWFLLRRKPHLTNIAIYAALAIWVLSLFAAFIWRT